MGHFMKSSWVENMRYEQQQQAVGSFETIVKNNTYGMTKLQPRHVDLGNSNAYFQRQDA